MCTQQHPTHSGWGSPECGYHSVFLTPHFFRVGQPHLCMWQRFTVYTLSLDWAVLHAVVHFVSSLLFQGGKAPYESTVAPHGIHTFPGQDSRGQVLQCLLAPLSPQAGEPITCIAQREQEATPCCTGWMNLQKRTFLHTLWCSPISTGSRSSMGGWDLLQHHASRPKSLDGAPTCYLGSGES